MTFTIQNLASAIERELHGRDVVRLQDIYETAYQAGLILLSECDPKETQRRAQVSPQLFDDETVYSAPEDFKASIDIYPTGGRIEGYEDMDDFRSVNQREMSMRKSIEAPMISEKWIDGTRYLLCRKYPSNTSKVQLEGFDATTGFSTGGLIGALSTNRLNYVQGSASMQLTLDGTLTQGWIEKSTLAEQDLTNYDGLGAWFMKVFIPSGYSSRFTSFKAYHGSGAGTDWFHKTVTTQHDGTSFRDGWNTLRFDWSTASESGSVDVTAMNYMQLDINHTVGTDIPGVLVDDFNVQLGTMYDLDYYSNFLFKTSAGVYLEKPTDMSDIITLSSDSYMVFSDLAALLACGEVGSLKEDYKRLSARVGWPTNPDDPFLGSLGTYKRRNPSQEPTVTTSLRDFNV